MRVWITRTEPGASRLAALLQERGFEVLKAPALRIDLLASSPPSQRFDCSVFVSEHAVHGATNNGWPDGARRNETTVAIGSAAHDALRRYGVEPTLPPQPSAAAVIDALPSVPHRTLIVKGEGGRDVLQRWLRGHGGKVAEWNVYRRVALAPDIASERIEAVVAASGEGLRVVAGCWRRAARDEAVALLVPSNRLAAQARQLGFRNVVVTLGASDTAVARTLVRLTRAGKSIAFRSSASDP